LGALLLLLLRSPSTAPTAPWKRGLAVLSSRSNAHGAAQVLAWTDERDVQTGDLQDRVEILDVIGSLDLHCHHRLFVCRGSSWGHVRLATGVLNPTHHSKLTTSHLNTTGRPPGSLPAATASRRARWAVPCGYGHWGSKQSELNH
jgi:hypothetical protein